MRTDLRAGLAADLHPQSPADASGDAGALLPSAFQLLAVHWHDGVLEPADLGEYLTPHWINNASVFHVPEPPRLRRLLGCTLAQWEAACGSAYLGTVPAKLLLMPHLRYCRQCLASGWHTSMFQHVAVTSCPLHGSPLRQGCPQCNKAIALTPASIATHQHFCPHCSQPFACMDRLRARLRLRPELPASFVRLAAALTPDPSAVLAAYKSDLAAHELLDADRTTTVACAAHRSWPAGMTPGTRWFAQTTRRVAATDPVPLGRLNELAHQGQVAALKSILECLRKRGVGLNLPGPTVVASLRSGARMDMAMPLCNAAYLRTALALELQEVLPGRRPIKWLAPLHTEWLPMHEELIAATASSQVYSLFLLNLVQLRRLRNTVDVAWNWTPHPACFSPPWRLWRRDEKIIFEIRQRASDRTLRRLVRRYAKHRLRSTATGPGVS